jgi:hypothetical protein
MLRHIRLNKEKNIIFINKGKAFRFPFLHNAHDSVSK